MPAAPPGEPPRPSGASPPARGGPAHHSPADGWAAGWNGHARAGCERGDGVWDWRGADGQHMHVRPGERARRACEAAAGHRLVRAAGRPAGAARSVWRRCSVHPWAHPRAPGAGLLGVVLVAPQSSPLVMHASASMHLAARVTTSISDCRSQPPAQGMSHPAAACRPTRRGSGPAGRAGERSAPRQAARSCGRHGGGTGGAGAEGGALCQ